MSNNAVVMCAFCLGSVIVIFGLLQVASWTLCFEFCLTEGDTGGNFYLGICTGFLAVLVGISGIAYLCLLHSAIVILTLIFDAPLICLSSISFIISIVNISEEMANAGTGVVYLVAQSVFCALIGIVSIIVAIQFCCIQNKNFEEEGDSENPLKVRQGPERYNPYVDDDSRPLPNGGFSQYHVSHPSSTSNGGVERHHNHQRGRVYTSNPRPVRTADRNGRIASDFLGRRSPRTANSHPRRPGGTADRNDEDIGTLNSFQLGPILGNFDPRGDRAEVSGSVNHVSTEDVSLPDFNEDQLDQDDARYRDNTNYFY